MTMTRLLPRLLLVVALLGALAPGDALAQGRRMKPAARRHLDRGMKHYQDRAFERAIVELKKGQRLDPRPEFLYALGQVYRASGDCVEAIRYYDAFLETAPPEKQAAAARTQIDRCKEQVEPSTPPPPEPKPEPAPEVKPPAPVAAPAVVVLRRPWYRDWIGHSLVATGVAAVVVGVVVWQSGRTTIDAAWAAATYDGYEAQVGKLSRADAMQQGGVAMMAAGGALVASGVLHYVLRRKTETRTAFGVSAGSRRALLTAGGTF